jgi:hypothetical protein
MITRSGITFWSKQITFSLLCNNSIKIFFSPLFRLHSHLGLCYIIFAVCAIELSIHTTTSECIELQGSVNMLKQIDVDFEASQNQIINFVYMGVPSDECVYI